MYNVAEAQPYIDVIEALVQDTTGADNKRALGASLRAGLIPPSAEQQIRNGVRADAREYTKLLDWYERLGHLIGQSAPSISAHCWYNHRSAGSDSLCSASQTQLHSVAFDDGAIWLVLFGNFTGPEGDVALRALYGIQRVRDAAMMADSEAPPIHLLYVTSLLGYWNDHLISPDSEAAHLERYYLETMHLTFPVALWGGPKQHNADGGVTPTPNPNFTTYGVSAINVPQLVVIDARGIVRHIVFQFSREDEMPLVLFLRRLRMSALRQMQ